jgi:hypothetical protein
VEGSAHRVWADLYLLAEAAGYSGRQNLEMKSPSLLGDFISGTGSRNKVQGINHDDQVIDVISSSTMRNLNAKS